MRKHIFLSGILMLCCVLFSCGNFFEPQKKSAITFGLPAVPAWGGVSNSRSVTFGADDYYKVTCTNKATGSVIYAQEHTSGDTVTINDVDAGSYEVTVSLFQKDDALSCFRNSFVESSSASATCTVKGGGTTSLTLEMTLPVMYGWRMEAYEFPVPYCGIDNYGLSYHDECCSFGIINPTEKEGRQCTVTVTVEGETPVSGEHELGYHDEQDVAAVDFDGSEQTSQKVKTAIAGKKAFTVKVWVSDSEQYILSVSPCFAEMCADFDKLVDSDDDIYSSDFCFRGVSEASVIYLFKENPRIAVFLDAFYPAEETENGTKSAVDYVQFGTYGDKYTDLVYSQSYEAGEYLQGFGAYFDSFDALKASVSKAVTSDGFPIKFVSSAIPELNYNASFSPEATAALASWLGVTIPGSNTGGGGQTTLTTSFSGPTPSEWEAWVLDSSGASVATMSNSRTSCKVQPGNYSIIVKGKQSSQVYAGAKKNVAVSGATQNVSVNMASVTMYNPQASLSVASEKYNELSYDSMPNLVSTDETSFLGWEYGSRSITRLADIADTTSINEVYFRAAFSEPPRKVTVTVNDPENITQSKVFLLDSGQSVISSGRMGDEMSISNAQYIVAFAETRSGEIQIGLTGNISEGQLYIDSDMYTLKAVNSATGEGITLTFEQWIVNCSASYGPLLILPMGEYRSWVMENGYSIANFYDLFYYPEIYQDGTITLSCEN